MSSVVAPAPYLTDLWERVPNLRRIVLVGLPGTGKSLLVKEIASAARGAGRVTDILQWDISRSSWDRDPQFASRFPEIDGITHAAIRVAMGTWVRRAVADWSTSHHSDDRLLVVEAPLIGGRFSELAHALDDDAEPALTDQSTLFVVIAPTGALRDTLRSQRAADMESAGDDEPERHNASADLLDELTDSLRDPARELGIATAGGSGYDSELYVALMRHVLRRRQTLVIHPDTLMTVTGSVYTVGEKVERLAPDATAVRDSLHAVDGSDDLELAARTDAWFRI